MGELLDMVEAVAEDERRRAEDSYFRTAWQTSHLMNATGNYRRAVTPDKLLGRQREAGCGQRFKNREEKIQALEQLKKKFGE